MNNDLSLFSNIKGLKVFVRGKNRAIVYVDETLDVDQLRMLAHSYAMITLISQSYIDIDIENTVATLCEKVAFKAVPKDKMIYEALGKGLKEYEYYNKSFMFTSIL